MNFFVSWGKNQRLSVSTAVWLSRRGCLGSTILTMPFSLLWLFLPLLGPPWFHWLGLFWQNGLSPGRRPLFFNTAYIPTNQTILWSNFWLRFIGSWLPDFFILKPSQGSALSIHMPASISLGATASENTPSAFPRTCHSLPMPFLVMTHSDQDTHTRKQLTS